MSYVIKPRVLMKSKDRRDYVINKLCEYWNMERSDFVNPRARTKELFHRKRIAVKILRDEAELSFKDIKNTFTHGDEAGIWQILQGITDDLGSGFSTNKELKAEYKETLQYLGL